MVPNKISIITVCFNAEKTIENTIKSVINQSYTNIEYIIIDGASNDNTLPVIEQFKSESTIIVSEPDSGIYNAMNKGIEASTGDYLLFLNADDHLLSNTVIENFIAKIKDNRGADIFYGDLLIYNHTNGTGKIWKAKQVSGKVLYNSTLPHPSTIYCRSIFEELGGYDESFKITADHDFFVQAYVKGKKFQYIKTIGVSVFNKKVTTSKHFGPLRATLRVLYSINDIQSKESYIDVGGVKNHWRENKLFIFDDTLMHQSVNQTDELRYCLFIDILRPSRCSWFMNMIVRVMGVSLGKINRFFYKNWSPLG